MKATNAAGTTEGADPVCVIVSQEEPHYFDSEGGILKLRPDQQLNFEAKKVIKVNIACVGRPGAGAGASQRISEEAEVSVVVTDAPDAPRVLGLVQDEPFPREGLHMHTGTTTWPGPVVIGTVFAMDDDANALPFSMRVHDPATWVLQDQGCEAVADDKQQCSYTLLLNRSISAADTALCALPDAMGVVYCRAGFTLVDGKHRMLSSRGSVSVGFRDVPDAPKGVKVDVQELVVPLALGTGLGPGQHAQQGAVFGRIEVEDDDGRVGRFGRQGHTLHMRSTGSILGLQKRPRAPEQHTEDEHTEDGGGGFVWQFVLLRPSALDPRKHTHIQLDFDVTDLHNKELTASVAVRIPVVASEESLAAQRRVSIQATHSHTYSPAASTSAAVPFGLPAGSVFDTVVFDGPDVGGMGEVQLVKLIDGGMCDGLGQEPVYVTKAAGGGSGDHGGSVAGQADYEKALQAMQREAGTTLTMCEHAHPDELAYTLTKATTPAISTSTSTIISGGGSGGRAWNVAVGSAVGHVRTKTYGVLDASHYLRVDATATILYYKLSVRLANACESNPCDGDGSRRAGGAGGSQVHCSLCSLGTVQTSEHPVRVCTPQEVERGYMCSDGQSKGKGEGEGEGTYTPHIHADSARAAGGFGIVATTLGIALTVAGATVVVCVAQKQRGKHRAAIRVLESRRNFERVLEMAGSSGQGWVAGVKNPLFGWYQPSMTRADCTSYLDTQDECAFVVRDSQSMPGWHMLCVKTNDTVVHDKIRRTSSGSYELLPTLPVGVKLLRQPAFQDMMALLEHYIRPHEGMPYTLALDDPDAASGTHGNGNINSGSVLHVNHTHTVDDAHAPSRVSPGKSTKLTKRGNRKHNSLAGRGGGS